LSICCRAVSAGRPAGPVSRRQVHGGFRGSDLLAGEGRRDGGQRRDAGSQSIYLEMFVQKRRRNFAPEKQTKTDEQPENSPKASIFSSSTSIEVKSHGGNQCELEKRIFSVSSVSPLVGLWQ